MSQISWHCPFKSITHIIYNLFVLPCDLTSSQGIKPSQRWSYSKVMGRAKVRPGGVFFQFYESFHAENFLKKLVAVESTGPQPSPSSLTMPDSGAQRLCVIPTERLSRHHTCCMRGPSGPHLLQELFSWSLSHKCLAVELQYTRCCLRSSCAAIWKVASWHKYCFSHIFQSPGGLPYILMMGQIGEHLLQRKHLHKILRLELLM